MLLKTETDEVQHLFSQASLKSTAISSVSIAWHLDHVLKVIIHVMDSLKNSDPSTFKWKFNTLRMYIYLRGSIPRGKARAPKAVRPPEIINQEALESQLDVAKKLLSEIDLLPKNSNFKHPYFGFLNVKMTRWFLKLHTEHHLKIARDIIKHS